MPVKSKFNILGLEVQKDTPTVAEWSSRWGEDSIRIEATSNVWYRSTAAETRELFLHGREEVKEDGKVKVEGRKGVDDLTGIPRNTIKVNLQSKNADGTPKSVERWDPNDSEQKYFNRVCATLVSQGKFPNVEAAKASFQALLQECVDITEFDASKAPPAERKAKGIRAEFKELAEKVVAKGNGAKLAKQLSKALGRPIEETVDALARAAQEVDENEEKARRAASKARIAAAMGVE
jgi:hypothetical protein